MSKFNIIKLWNEYYGNKEEVNDYSGRLMKKSACSNPNSRYHPTIDHIRPLSSNGKDIKVNIIICHRNTNEEKGDKFPTWKANGKIFQAKRVKGTSDEYYIRKMD